MKPDWIAVCFVVCFLGFGLGVMLIERESVTDHESVHVRAFQEFNISSHIDYRFWGATTVPDDLGQVAQLCQDKPAACQKLADEAMLNDAIGYNMAGIEFYLMLIAFLLFAIFMTLLLRE